MADTKANKKKNKILQKMKDTKVLKNAAMTGTGAIGGAFVEPAINKAGRLAAPVSGVLAMVLGVAFGQPMATGLGAGILGSHLGRKTTQSLGNPESQAPKFSFKNEMAETKNRGKAFLDVFTRIIFLDKITGKKSTQNLPPEKAEAVLQGIPLGAGTQQNLNIIQMMEAELEEKAALALQNGLSTGDQPSSVPMNDNIHF